MKGNPTIALIVAAGSSSRFDGDVPKPYINLAGRAVLAHSLEVFCNHPRIDGVRVVISRTHHPLYKKAAKDFSLFPPVIGGARRQDSVRIGLEAIQRVNPGKVLIHDAARPLVNAELIDRVLDGLGQTSAVLPALPVTDTVHQQASKGELVQLDRSQLYAAQTPQGFDFKSILAAHQQSVDQEVTDDIALAKHAGLEVKQVDGLVHNIKLTTEEQLGVLEYMIKETSQEASSLELRPMRESAGERGGIIKVGQGIDVHAFESHLSDTPQDQQVVHLCGMRIPHTHKLKGHSDADVGLHALVDALLGAMAEGDIGEYFPPTDPKWQDADSKLFVEHVYTLLQKKGGAIQHIDLTIIGEQPKIAPYRDAMRQQLASLLQLDVKQVSIKATTTEKLGFLGRSEGLAAQAIATITLPL